MTYIPPTEDRDMWALLGAILATLVALFTGTTLARRAAEKRAAELEAAEAAADEAALHETDFTDSVPQP